jgi:hypothetical protein
MFSITRGPRLRRRLLHMTKQTLWLPVAIGVALLTTPVSGYELDKELLCRSDPHGFISQLMTDKAIDPQPMEVTAASVNAFRPAVGRKLTAFGFEVRAVIGFAPADGMFAKGTGKPASVPVYGAVVKASDEAVIDRLREADSPAIVKEVLPLLMSAIICQSD